MKRRFIVALIIAVVVIISFAVAGVILLSDYIDKSISDDSCVELGCSFDTLYVGSINSDKYYECSCRWAKNIKPENIVCFSSEQEAEDKAYVKSEC